MGSLKRKPLRRASDKTLSETSRSKRPTADRTGNKKPARGRPREFGSWTTHTFTKHLKKIAGLNKAADWKRADPSSYEAAERLGLANQVIMEMGWSMKGRRSPYTDWDAKKIVHLLRAMKIKDYRAWKERHSLTYAVATKHGFYREVATAMGWRVSRSYSGWDAKRFAEFVKKDLKAKNLNEWRRKSASSLSTTFHRGIYHDVARELGWFTAPKRMSYRGWGVQEFTDFASRLGVTSVSEWMREHPNSVAAAYRLGVMLGIRKKLGWV